MSAGVQGAAASRVRPGAVDVVLRDGSTARIRPVEPADAPAIRRFLAGLSEESRWLRYFSGAVDLAKATSWAAGVDDEHRFGLVATVGEDGEIVAHGGYERERDRPERAEIAFEVADRLHGQGLGTILLGHLAEHAAASGVTVFEAEVLPANRAMLNVLRDSGFPTHLRTIPGLVLVELPTSLSAEARERFEYREQSASVAALRHLLEPRSIAVIGASRRRDTIGGQVFHNLLAAGFTGPVFPVNPNTPVVQSVRAYRSVLDVPEPVDLAVVVVPAAHAVEVARECAQKGVHGLVVLSAGFGETGGDGDGRQAELLEVCRASGMRLVGPNCLGVISTDPDVCMDATFGPVLPAPGRVGFLSQSGALGLAIIEYTGALGLGLSSFVSVGNKADISGNDLLAYWAQDPRTDVILLYLESFGNPRRFAHLARQVARTKPVVVVKSGRSVVGARAASSHTGALVAASDATVDALCRQAGVIRTDTLGELFDVAKLLAGQPVPRGSRVGILTNAGGPGILAADACAANGLSVPALSDGLRARLAEFLPAEAALGNPVDLIASAPAAHYRRTLELLLASGEVDAVLAIAVPTTATDPAAVAVTLQETVDASAGDLPVLSVIMSPSRPAPTCGDQRRVPCYDFPEDAIRALAHAAGYGAWLARPADPPPKLPDVRREEAAALLATALTGGPRWLAPDEVAKLLDCYRLPVAEWRLARTPAQAGAYAEALGGDLVLKAVASEVVHKTEAGAVWLGLSGNKAVTGAAQTVAGRLEAAGHPVEGFLVQRMAPEGTELLVGVVQDPSFGPVVAVGAGGTQAELLRDVAVRLTPVTPAEAAEMVRSLRTYPLLEGYRGAPRADVAALEDVLVRLGALADSHPEIAELDCNPVRVLPEGAVVLDARVRIAPAQPTRPMGARS